MNVGTAIRSHAIPKQSKRKSVNVVELFTEQMRVIRRNRKDKSASGQANKEWTRHTKKTIHTEQTNKNWNDSTQKQHTCARNSGYYSKPYLM